MYRCWQVGAEDFVSRADAARLQGGNARPRQTLDWVGRNLDELRTTMAGMGAVVGDRVVAHAPSVPPS
jgi:hypothetical protein